MLCPYHSLTPDLHYVLNKLLLVPKAFSQTALRLKMTSAYTYNNDNKTDKIRIANMISLIELHKYWCPLCSSHASKTTDCDKNTMCSVDQLPHKRRYWATPAWFLFLTLWPDFSSHLCGQRLSVGKVVGLVTNSLVAKTLNTEALMFLLSKLQSKF